MSKETTEGILLPALSWITSPEGDTRVPAEKSATAASLSPSKDDGKIPHYRRSSTGSCHDACKYGRRHSFRLRRIHTTPEEQNQKKSPSLAGRQKKSGVKQKASAHLETGLLDKQNMCEAVSLSSVKTVELVEGFEVIESPVTQEVSAHLETELRGEQRICEEESLTPVKTAEPVEGSGFVNQNVLCLEKTGVSEGFEPSKCRLPSPSNKIETSDEFEAIKECTCFERIISCDGPETVIQEITSPKKSEAPANPEAANSKNHHVKKTDSSLERASTEQRTGPSKNHPSSSFRPKLAQRAPSPAQRAFSSGKSKVGKQEAPTPAKRFDASARPTPSGTSKATPLKSTSLQSPTGTTHTKGESLPISGGKKTLKPLSASRMSQPPPDQVSNFNARKLKNTNTKSSSAVKQPKKLLKADLVDVKVKEKTIRVVEPRSAGGKSAFAKACDSVSEHGTAKIKREARNEDKRSLRRVEEDEYPTPHKLMFRRGKVVNSPSANEDPRRLKFRPGRIGYYQGGRAVEKRSFQGKEPACEDRNHPRPEAQMVVLRHQEVRDKRGSQGLFNDVIEETASKLVETRKSKVKALVGAFETVISLQENKATAPI